MPRVATKLAEEQHSYTTSAYQSNPIVYGAFPTKSENQIAKDRLNRCLSTMLGVLVVILLISYYFVSSGEKTMNQLSREIVALTNDNIELQNKLDNLHSFNHVDKVIRQSNMLDTAQQVIEVPAVAVTEIQNTGYSPSVHRWAIGY